MEEFVDYRDSNQSRLTARMDEQKGKAETIDTGQDTGTMTMGAV